MLPADGSVGVSKGGYKMLRSRLSTCCPTKRSKWRCSQHTSENQTPNPLCPRRVTWIQTDREGVYVKSGRSGALKPGKVNLA